MKRTVERRHPDDEDGEDVVAVAVGGDDEEVEVPLFAGEDVDGGRLGGTGSGAIKYGE